MVDYPLVSVCIPVYNGARYLQDTLQSACVQTYKNLEIIVQDNASTDGTAEIIDRMSGQDPRILCERNAANVSMAVNWNLVTRRPRGKYVLLLSADDLIDPTFVQTCVEHLESDHELDFVSTEHRLLSGSGIRSRKITSAAGRKMVKCTEILLKNPFSINFTVFRRAYLERLSMTPGRVFRDPYYTCDYDLWIRSGRAAANVYFVPEAMATYRVHDASLSSNRTRMLKQTALVLSANRNFLLSACPFVFRFTMARLLARLVLRDRGWARQHPRLLRYLTARIFQ